jgi:ABC-type dipeptide/oligopeptide/nickel transport system permease component
MSIIPVFLLAALLTTGMIHLSPVDPAEAYLTAAHIEPTDEILAQKRRVWFRSTILYAICKHYYEDMPT